MLCLSSRSTLQCQLTPLDFFLSDMCASAQIFVLSVYCANFKKKVLRYICTYGNRLVTQNDAHKLLNNAVTEETMAGDSSINSKLVHDLLLNVMATGDFWDVVNFFEEIQQQSPLFNFSLKKMKRVDPKPSCGAQLK